MDVRFDLNGLQFVWNAEKAASNARKHDGVTFEQAAHVFFDPFFSLVDASRNLESRNAIIGFDHQSQLLFVVHMESSGEDIRIISARKASKLERRHHEDPDR